MSDKTGIEWTDASWNPVTGCSKVSQGCKHCYAERQWPRLSAPRPKPNIYTGREFTDVRCHPERLDQPLRWTRPRRIFVNSMSDLFHPDVPESFILSVFVTMALARQHTFQILTKRAARMRNLMTRWKAAGLLLREGCGVELSNVWLGVSVEDQATADERIPPLLQTPAAVRWISAEPLLGPIDLRRFNYNYLDKLPVGVTSLDWVVAGGESGPKARPMHPAWARSLRDQCAAAGVPFLFKQWGEWCPSDQPHMESILGGTDAVFDRHDTPQRVGKKAAGRLLDGVLHDGYPG